MDKVELKNETAILPNPCYKLAAVCYTETLIEAVTKRIKKKSDGKKRFNI